MLRGQPCSNPRWACFFFDISFRTPLFGGDIHSLRFRKNLTLGIFCLNHLGKRKKHTYHGANSSFWCKLLIFHNYSWYFVRSSSFAVLTVWPSHPLSLTWLQNRAKLNEVCTETHGCGGCTRGARWQKRGCCCPGDSVADWSWHVASHKSLSTKLCYQIINSRLTHLGKRKENS